MAALKMFEDMADKIFEKADVTKEEFPAEWDQCVEILSAKMAMVSGMGLSYARVDVLERQKQSLVEDLKEIKKQRMN